MIEYSVGLLLIVLLAAAVLWKSATVRVALSSTCDHRAASVQTRMVAPRAARSWRWHRLSSPPVSEDMRQVTVTGVAVGYTPPTVQGVADSDGLQKSCAKGVAAATSITRLGSIRSASGGM